MQFRLALVLGLSCGGVAASGGAAAPNIVFILADDLGWTDTSVAAASLGNASDFYETPNLEALAAKGMTFTHAYTTGANCAPTRAALLSGQYAPRAANHVFAVGDLNRTAGQAVPLIGASNGLPTGEDQIPGSAITIAETLRAAGYATAHFGKYHVGDPTNAALANGPLEQGFDANFGGQAAGHPGSTYFADAAGAYASANVGPELDAYASPGEHLTDATTDAALDFMSRQTTKPFYLNLAYHAVHTPVADQGRADLVSKYEAKTPGLRHDNADYAALVEGVDEAVGRIVNYLETTPDPLHPGQMLAANTLLVFTSDNGGLEAGGVTENSPLKGQKGEYDEGGIRVPMFAVQPGVVPAGTVNSTPVSTVDFYPTFAAAAQASPPPGYVLDGENLLPILADESAALARDAIFWHFPGYLLDSGRDQRPQTVMVKTDGAHEWKLFYNYEDQSYELYDLAADVGETTNLAATETTVVRDLALEMATWLLDVGAEMPTVAATGVPAPLPALAPGDLTGDGQVGVADWLVLRADLFHDLSGVSPSEAYFRGDLNRDGRNDEADFLAFKQYYLAANPGGSVNDLVSIVPEPTGLGLVTAGVAAAAVRRILCIP